MLNMIKNILFVSYLKNKGIKRICFILGGLPFILCLVTFFVEGARTPGYVLTGIIAFYVPFLLASAMVWVYRGFKDNISISMSDYLVLINSVEVVLFPQYEFDVSLNQKRVHFFARDYLYEKDTVLVYVGIGEDNKISDYGSINKTQEASVLDNLVAAIIEGTFVDHRKDNNVSECDIA